MPHAGLPSDDLGCGGAESLCLEREEMLGPWKYQGEGGGAWNRVEDMKFVGQGQGNWGRERVLTGWRVRTCSLCFCFLLLLAALGVIGFYIFGRVSPAAGHSEQHSGSTARMGWRAGPPGRTPKRPSAAPS
ncbi:unnamed protein product [Effrenium voratum]|uniref:Uncharacterized protein n=1 Tax=Effrenium voratum TaxID=2562239 RepID=A0AA36IZZ5_9DINO|nr:unnamed protein product [Effrenium voratum]